jgi:hypothetical protein
MSTKLYLGGDDCVSGLRTFSGILKEDDGRGLEQSSKVLYTIVRIIWSCMLVPVHIITTDLASLLLHLVCIVN